MIVGIADKEQKEDILSRKLLKEFNTNLGFYFSEALERPFAKPHWIYISLSHKCTYRCRMCGVVNILQGRELPLETVKSVLDEISSWDTDCVVTFTGGEPFLRQDIFEIFKHAAAKGVKAEVVSNGACINKELAQKIINSGITNIAISLDGAKEATHDFVRQKGSFQKALNALKLLTAVKKEYGRGPQISVWTTIMKENVLELYELISLVKGVGVECLVYHPVIVAQDDMQNTSPAAPFWLRDEKRLEELKKQIDRINAYKARYGLVAFLHDPYLWLNYFKGTLSRKDWKCNPFVFINIGPDAQLRSCGAAFGDAGKAGINACLRTEQAFQARRLMKLCDKPCLQTCWAHPESDSLEGIIRDFCLKLKKADLSKEEKKKIIDSALVQLNHYENIIKEKNAAVK